MSMLDDFMAKVSESNVSDSVLIGMINSLDNFAKEQADNQEILGKLSEIRGALVERINCKELLYNDYSLQNETGKPMDAVEVAKELGNLQAMENNPAAYMNRCEEILQNPRDVTLAEQAIYGMGKMVEKAPSVAPRAVELMERCVNNEKLLELDTTHPRMPIIGPAMTFCAEKISEKSEGFSPAGVYADSYNLNRNERLGDYYKKEADRQVLQSVLEANGGEIPELPLAFRQWEARKKEENRAEVPELPLVFRQWEAKQKKEQAEAAYPKMALDEDKLPQLRLAGNAGKDSVIFDLNNIAEDLKALKPGESLALGRAPEAVGAKGKTVKVGEDNNYVSRHHCDIRRNEQGKLELVDRSMNGTEILNGKNGANRRESALHNLLDASRGPRKTNLLAESKNTGKVSGQKRGQVLGQMKQRQSGGR